MEKPSGILGRVGERVLAGIVFVVLIAVGIGIWRLGPAGRAALLSGLWRGLLWLAIAAVLPWCSRLFMRRVLEISSNWAGVILLATFTLIDVVAGLVLLGGLPHGGWGWLLALAALVGAGTYNYLVSEYLAEQAGG